MSSFVQSAFPAATSRPSDAPLPLGGIRIVDFTHFIAGPLATMVLADMGADVLKVEAQGRGDDFRQYPPVLPDIGAGPPFVWCNRNKRSLALDLKADEGRAIALELIAKADVVVENFSTGVMGRLGLDYELCRERNPRLIYCSVSAYGRDGAYADRLGFDPIAQAESGFISMNGYPDRDGVRTLSPVMDMSTAILASNAILGALMARERTGRGQKVEVSLFESAVFMTGYASFQQLFSGKAPRRPGNTSPDTCPSGLFHASDGSFLINCGNTGIFQRLLTQVLDMPELASDPAYATNKDRLERRDEIFALLQQAFGARPWAYWRDRMRDAGVPCGEVRTVGDAIRSPEAQDRKIVTRIPHPVLGWIPNMALPIRYSDTPLADPVAAPRVGEHAEALLHEWLSYDGEKVKALQQRRIVGA
ncbi:MAG: CoA transferase [Burkholderiaceae bacterium]